MLTRWADNDMFGHLNNAVYYQLFDTAINAWINTRTGLDPLTTAALGIVAESGCRYFSELHFPQELVVGLAVTRLGRSSVTYRLAVFNCSPGAGRDRLGRGRSPRWGTGCTSTLTASAANPFRSPRPSAHCWPPRA
ncbi:thioesterase superfamily protein [Mycobacterium ulcerans str. Harvey]|uniref:Thioesterase superfamily protein n=1 Tax=Mycobacterium ulcerans str. Harvey TaxID=1299332 RepID=A0ABN0R3X5_MYCUL|nr:thioesterase superfamily protein [Mycobacterium ulcerans str. Harvey]